MPSHRADTSSPPRRRLSRPEPVSVVRPRSALHSGPIPDPYAVSFLADVPAVDDDPFSAAPAPDLDDPPITVTGRSVVFPRRADAARPRVFDADPIPTSFFDDDSTATAGTPEPVVLVEEPASPPLSRRQALAAERGRPRADAEAGVEAVQEPPTEAVSRGRRSSSPLSLPQVGIASGLGLLTIAAPLTGVMAGPPAKAAVNSVTSAAAAFVGLAPGAAFPRTAGGTTAVEALSLVPDDGALPSVPVKLAAPRTIIVVRVSRASERALLPGCDGTVPVTTVSNGQLPASDLCTLWDRKHQLRADAAIALAKLNLMYRKQFGHDLCLSDAYRTLSQQYTVKRLRGYYAATPGTSEHGWGLAIDACDGIDQGASNPNYRWMMANGPAFGWVNPLWARPGGSGPHENWHFEYLPGEQTSDGPSD